MNPTRTRSDNTATICRQRVSALVAALPDGRAVPMGEGHLSLEVRGRRFGWFLEDHHGDGRVALNLKAPQGARERLVAYAPDTFHVPKYLGRHGWIGIWLDTPAPDWAEIAELIQCAAHSKKSLAPREREGGNWAESRVTPLPEPEGPSASSPSLPDAGGRRGLGRGGIRIWDAPLSDSLPARASQGEREKAPSNRRLLGRKEINSTRPIRRTSPTRYYSHRRK